MYFITLKAVKKITLKINGKESSANSHEASHITGLVLEVKS